MPLFSFEGLSPSVHPSEYRKLARRHLAGTVLIET
jgi:hypothetical protein